MSRFIPVNKPMIDERELEEVKKVLEGGQLTSAETLGGSMVRRFEREFASYVGSKHAIAVNSGTSALYASLLAAGVKAGDEVVIPAFTFAATANVVLLLGARPVFADIELRTYNLDPNRIEGRLTERTKAIIPVHLYGMPAEMDPILELAESRGLLVIEDACQALGAEYRGRSVGIMGHTGCYSFYASKVMTTGEGGMIVTDDAVEAERLRMIRNHGQVKGWDTSIVGGNLRMPELEAAIGTVQLGRLPQFLEARRRNAKEMTERLREVGDLFLPYEPLGFRSNWYLYTVRLVEGRHQRDRVVEELNRMGVGAAVYYPTPLHKLPLYQSLHYGGVRLPISELAARGVFSLPVNPAVTQGEVEYIADCVKRCLGKTRSGR
jgi:perosamine synthetase